MRSLVAVSCVTGRATGRSSYRTYVAWQVVRQGSSRTTLALVPIYRIQVARTFASAPLFGKWRAYTAFWFEADDDETVQTETVQEFVSRLASGAPPDSSALTYGVYGYNTGNVAQKYIVYKWTGPGTRLEFVSEDLIPYGSYGPTSSTGLWYAPLNVGLSMQYLYPATGTRQTGRARWFIGPLKLAGAGYTTAPNMRLADTRAQGMVNNCVSTILALQTEGLVMQVHSGTGDDQTWHPVTRVFCDDVLDQLRSRKPWPITYGSAELA